MAIDYEALLERTFPLIEHAYDKRDVMLYALSIGLGADPLDEAQLRFVYEDGLEAFPTMAAVLAAPGLWIRESDTGLAWEHFVHVGQDVEFLRPLATAGTIVARTRVSGIVDKGPGRGALVYTERTGVDPATGEAVFRVHHTGFARRDGGFGGPAGPVRPAHPLPDRAPDVHVDVTTLAQQSLLYRLNGDPNPHNAHPAAARRSGFPRPILHGLCTYGIAGHAILAQCCDYQPARLARLEVRLSAPVFPGETLRTEIWRGDGETVAFRTRALDRDAVVLTNGRAELRG